MGFMRGLGRPVFGYSNDAQPFLNRVIDFCGATLRRRPPGEYEDSDGMVIEPFTLHDNLMLAGGIVSSGGRLVAEQAPHAERYTSLAAFERCVMHAASALLR
jgi:nucleoside 2-deoxyribosyltransferase